MKGLYDFPIDFSSPSFSTGMNFEVFQICGLLFRFIVKRKELQLGKQIDSSLVS